MDALRVSETTGSVRAAILAALRNDRIVSPYGQRHTVTIEDLDAHGTYADGKVSIGGFETRVVCPSHMGSDCVLPIGHSGSHKSE